MSAPHAPIALETLARHIGATLEGPAEQMIAGVATLRQASATELSFYSNRQYLKDLQNTRAGAVILSRQDTARCPVAKLVMDNPYLGYAQAARLLHPLPAVPPGIHPTAWVDPHTAVDASVYVGARAVIHDNVVLHPGVRIGAGCVIDSGVEIGADTCLEANVTLCRGTRIGCRGLIHPGAVIGADGFGLAHTGQQWYKVPQLGGVIIGDDVEIGANTTIDRGTLEDTIIEDDVKIDNLVQIAHNVYIGAHTAIAGCAGIAGSTRIGSRCLIGGGVGIVGHITIADDVHITGGSNVLQSITEAGVYSAGTPLQTNKRWHRNYIRFKQLDEMAGKLDKLLKKL